MEPSKISVLLQVFDDFQHILLRYSSDYTMRTPRKGYIQQYWEWSQKIDVIKSVIEEIEKRDSKI